jgi:DHA1 family tetracycline resistance protein-like MFS transporter
MSRIANRELISVIAVVSMAVMAMSILQPVLPLYLTSLGISPTVLGLMFSIGMVGMVFGETGGGWLADKAGIKLPMGMGTFACVPLILCFVLTDNTTAIFIIFLIWGVVRAGVFGPGRGYIGSTVPFERKGTYLAIFAAATAVTRSIGSFIGGYIGDHLGYDWNFYVSAGISLLGGVLMLIFLNKVPRGQSALLPPPQPLKDIKAPEKPYRSRLFLAQCVIGVLCWTSIGVVGPFLPLMAVDVAGLDATHVGILFTIGALVSATMLVPMGRLSDRGNKRYMMVSGLLVAAAGLAGLALAKNFAGFIGATVVQSIGNAMFNPAAVSLLSDTVPRNWQNTAMGIYGGCEDMGIVIGSALGGFIWSAVGPHATFLLVGTTASVLAAITVLFFLRNKDMQKTVNR